MKTNLIGITYRPDGLLSSKDYDIVDREFETPCWVWRGKPKAISGYGAVYVGGRQRSAHRAMYEQEVGQVPAGLELHHLCAVKLCVNPAHLVPVTHAQNIRAKAATKLTEIDIAEIHRLRGSGLTYAAISARFGVNAATIGDVLHGRTWRDLHPNVERLNGCCQDFDREIVGVTRSGARHYKLYPSRRASVSHGRPF